MAEPTRGATREHVLVIDHGTQSVRAMLFDARGELTAKSRVPVRYHAAQPGWSEANPDDLWGAVAEACRALWASGAVPKEAVRGVTLTTQRGTVVNVDAEGRALRPAITWLDRRRTEGLPRVGGAWGALFRLSGMSDTVAAFQAEAEANWIARHQPEIWERTHRYLLLSGFLTHRLTGNFVDSVGAQVGYVPFDFKHLR
ncbi:MAG TPA: FGGY family carbohydrate kinase, partial [Gemmatimonadaceae bacterium]|nr:FGGY family carbohydrate kinase [Gemmatimonadaceae bacterium]